MSRTMPTTSRKTPGPAWGSRKSPALEYSDRSWGVGIVGLMPLGMAVYQRWLDDDPKSALSGVLPGGGVSVPTMFKSIG
jgi:hypothetical protein